jgi:radical SAM protein with 4Fe4S-binding SPASM domain
MLEEIYKLDPEDIKSVEWTGDHTDYDLQLYSLGRNQSKFMVVNPWLEDDTLHGYIKDIPSTNKCIIWKYNDEWVAKYFNGYWTPEIGYEVIQITKPTLVWSKNPDLDRLMTFEDDPYSVFEPNPWESEYTLVWYLDPRVNPLPDKVWAIRCQPTGKKTMGTKDMGFVMPALNVEHSKDLPDLGVNIDECYPAFWDIANECAWELDPIHTPDKRMWVVKFSPLYRKPKIWKWYGIISPQFHIEYNPALPDLEYDLDYVIPYHDFTFEHMWMLDNKHLQNGEEEIWAFKTKVAKDITGNKNMGYISPLVNVEYNSDLPNMECDIDYIIPWYDFEYEHILYMPYDSDKIWVAKLQAVDEPNGYKEIGEVSPVFPDVLDVIFISYNEPNAEENWRRVLSKAPYAKRVDGVDGIFNAHKAAAKLATTDMFYVVDGDAYLVDDWKFDYQPGLFDRDCAYVWHSKNPVNGLTYGYGGVKLFSKKILMKTKQWKTLDMSMSIMPKLKIMDTISNITAFNTDEFSTWRSAFRECVKLCYNIKQHPNDAENKARLDAWRTINVDPQFGQCATDAAVQALEFANLNINDLEALKLINNRNWLEERFNLRRPYLTGVFKKSDTICAVPWMHLNFEPTGKVIPCCLTSVHNYFAGDLTHQPIEEIWNSDNMKKLRKEMVAGEEPTICKKCFEREKVTGESGRFYHNRSFPEVLKKIPSITLADGTCTEMELKYWDFRFSNLCNFKCRSCGPRYSSAWVPDAKKLGYTDQEKVWSIDAVDDKTNLDFLKDQIQHVQKIYFAGGEPLLMPEHWQILEMLVENKRFDVQLNYNTNCSTLTYGGKNVLDYWKLWEFGKIEVWPSIDEIGERAELIRSGTVWSKIESNLKEIIKLDNVIVRPGITVGAWNVNRLPEIVSYFAEIGILKEKLIYRNFFVNLLEDPSHYHVHILPDEFRKDTIEKLETFIKEFGKKYDTDLEYLFTHIIHELKQPFDAVAANRFLEVTDQIDNLRNEKLMDVVPEMKVLLGEKISVPSPKKVIPIKSIPCTPRLDIISAPITIDVNKIVEIRNKSKNILLLTWLINNICTNHCSYCPSDVHNGSNHHYDWEHAKKFIESCFEKYKKIHCNISGGEPTVSPFFKDLVNLIYDNGGSMHLTTNLVRPLLYWTDLPSKFHSIAVSYHPEFITTSEQEDEFIEKLRYISNKTLTSVRVMMLPSKWDQCYDFYLKLVKNNNAFTTEMVRILPNFGVGVDYCKIEYTTLQNHILNSTPVNAGRGPLLKHRKWPVSVSMVTDGGNELPFTHQIQTMLENSSLANFKNWSCDIGLESLFVHYNGKIQRGNCGVGGTIGDIVQLDKVEWPSDSIVCDKTICHCSADLIISKGIK